MNNSFYDKLLENNKIRFHMPGHIGKPPYDLNVFAVDTTETPDTGNLYLDLPPFDALSKKCADYYGVCDVLLSTNGSSGSLMASIMTACASMTDKHLIVDRNCHKAVLHTLAMLDITPHFVYADIISPMNIPSEIPLEQIELALQNTPVGTPLLITSPNYYGIMQNIEGVSALCRKYDRFLIVDEAHGAHLPSIGLKSAVSRGANLCTVSLHKTLPALGQSSAILSDGSFSRKDILYALSVFNTSSPSYAILSSVDLCMSYMRDKGDEDYRNICEILSEVRHKINAETSFYALTSKDFNSYDKLRLSVFTGMSEFSGNELSDILHNEYNITAEMSNNDNIVFIVTGLHKKEEIYKILKILKLLSKNQVIQNPEICKIELKYPVLPQKTSVKTAFFAQSREVLLKDAAHQICAKPFTPYPPGVPLLYPSEEILPSVIEFITNLCYNDVEAITIHII